MCTGGHHMQGHCTVTDTRALSYAPRLPFLSSMCPQEWDIGLTWGMCADLLLCCAGSATSARRMIGQSTDSEQHTIASSGPASMCARSPTTQSGVVGGT